MLTIISWGGLWSCLQISSVVVDISHLCHYIDVWISGIARVKTLRSIKGFFFLFTWASPLWNDQRNWNLITLSLQLIQANNLWVSSHVTQDLITPWWENEICLTKRVEDHVFGNQKHWANPSLVRGCCKTRSYGLGKLMNFSLFF